MSSEEDFRPRVGRLDARGALPAVRHAALPVPTLHIRPIRGWIPLRLREVWEHRELLYFLVWRDVKVRYKQTALGAAWAVLQPLLAMVVFTIFFGRLARVGSDGVPYPVFSLAALLPWTFVSQGVTQSSNSLVSSANLIKKVYFPRMILPAASLLAGTVDFLFASGVLAATMAFYGVIPGVEILALPLFFLLAIATALGIGMWLATLNVEYRDVRYVVPFFVQIWLFVSPVIYPMSRVTEKLAELGLPEWLYGINPMAGVVQGFRWALLGTVPFPGEVLAASAAVAILLLGSGAFYLRRMETNFADVV